MENIGDTIEKVGGTCSRNTPPTLNHNKSETEKPRKMISCEDIDTMRKLFNVFQTAGIRGLSLV